MTTVNVDQRFMTWWQTFIHWQRNHPGAVSVQYPRALLPPLPPRPTHPYRTSYDWTAYVCVFWDYNRDGWRGVPELIPLRCRVIKREGLAWGNRCFLDKDHTSPCHF